MCENRIFRRFAVFGLAWLVLSSDLAKSQDTAAQDPWAGEFGVKFGYLGSSTVEYKKKADQSGLHTIETDAGYSGGGFLSQNIYRRLHATITVDFHFLQGNSVGETALDVAGGLKYFGVLPGGAVSLRPGMVMGFGILPDIWVFKASRHMTFKMFVELAFHTTKGTGLVIEIGSLRSFTGTDGTYDIKANSMLLFRGGLIL